MREYKAGTKTYEALMPFIRDEIDAQYPGSDLNEFSLYKVYFVASDGKKIDNVHADITFSYEEGTRLSLSDKAMGLVCEEIAFSEDPDRESGDSDIKIIEKNEYKNLLTGKRNPAVMTIMDQVASLSLNNVLLGGAETENLCGLLVLSPKEDEGREDSAAADTEKEDPAALTWRRCKTN